MSSFYKIPIQKIKSQTIDSVSIEFNIPKELEKNFGFVAGQYVSIKHELSGNHIIRDYSLACPPSEGAFRIGIKKTSEEGFSSYAVTQAKENDLWLISAPRGRFVLDYKPNEKRTICCFAAGSGITPIISHCKELLHEEPHAEVYLFFGNKSKGDIMFKKELDELEKTNSGFHLYHFFTSQQTDDSLFFGRFSYSKVLLIFNQLADINQVDKALICGPEDMTYEILSALVELGIPRQDIHFELFNASENSFFKKENKHRTNKSPVHVCVRLDNQKHEFIMDYRWPTSLLDAILENDIDAPYSCKGGVCSTCQCKIEHGQVEMDNNLTLTDQDIEQGWILACQAFPITDRIVVDFDDH